MRYCGPRCPSDPVLVPYPIQDFRTFGSRNTTVPFSANMMRIKEAIQRKKLIHEMNDDWTAYELDLNGSHSPLPPIPTNERETEITSEVNNGLQNFVQYLSSKLNDYQKRALKVTWKRLSEAPKTSGRGTILIMEKVLSKMCEKEPVMSTIFYKSAFLSCIEDRRCGRTKMCGSISTIRDHAHILVEFVDSILQCMFDGVMKDGLDPETIGSTHCKLMPLGFERRMWLVLGECFAEVMFNQECIRAYPHAPSAWSLLAVTMTDKMYAASKPHQGRRDLSLDAFRSTHIGSSSSSMSNSNEEVFVTARSEFDSPRCPFSNGASASSVESVRHPRIDPKRRLLSQQHASDYFLRKHPIRIPRPTFGRSHSEVRFSSIPSPPKSSFV